MAQLHVLEGSVARLNEKCLSLAGHQVGGSLSKRLAGLFNSAFTAGEAAYYLLLTPLPPCFPPPC